MGHEEISCRNDQIAQTHGQDQKIFLIIGIRQAIDQRGCQKAKEFEGADEGS